MVKRVQLHTKAITDMQLNADGSMFITASKDHTAKVGVSTIPVFICAQYPPPPPFNR